MRMKDIDKKKFEEAMEKMRELTLQKSEIERLEQLIIDQADIDRLPELKIAADALQAEINLIDYRKDEIIAEELAKL